MTRLRFVPAHRVACFLVCSSACGAPSVHRQPGKPFVRPACVLCGARMVVVESVDELLERMEVEA